MGFLAPTPTPYDPLEWAKKPLHERGKMVCAAWAMQGWGTPIAALMLYGFKIAGYIYAWTWFCGLSFGKETPIAEWWLNPLAFQKAIVWSMLFEVLGFGCGSGPLTGRYVPPIGGCLFWLRPGTTKLPLFPRLPVIGGHKRSFLDCGLYLALLVSCGRVSMAANPTAQDFVPIAVILPVLGLCDKTIFLCARSEHYWTTTVCFAFLGDKWLAGAMAVQLALWFWAGVSKLNHHFPTVACVMHSNNPFADFGFMRRMMYKDFPRDLNPSFIAHCMARFGTALEIGVPLAFVLTPSGTQPFVAIGLMLMLHFYITSNVPAGAPLEWNFMVVYAGFSLFFAHPDISFTMVGFHWVTAVLVIMLIVIPFVGNVAPAYVSFLLSMRYYAGNWAYSVWLLKGDSYKKLAKLKQAGPWVYDQLKIAGYPRAVAVGLLGRVMAFRMMHLHGRALPILVPQAIEGGDLGDYEWCDGELIAGIALGWNFGDGHLHDEQLLDALQKQCDFEAGEVRCIFVESQPLFGSSLHYRICDAKTGQMKEGHLPVSEFRTRQAWEAPNPKGAKLAVAE
eukprot:TRINITY_DN8872_c0_g1_i1.p1 TRINITY_DN8872_c0_g1~~TRINITY_DN8872_c0_g1_i1.p1  ORF type:complete len:561 (-),score=95.31 TRINITY_DN8872_c0_g1_i1:135-1817(-)